MAQKPRTPVHFPRMKIRGRRNKAKATQRFRRDVILPNALVSYDPAGHLTLTPASGEPVIGMFTVRTSSYVDGFGRPVPHIGPHKTVLEPVKPKPEPSTFETSYSFSAKVSGDTSALADRLFGRNADGEG